MIDDETAIAHFIELRPKLVQLAERLEDRLKALVAPLGIGKHSVSARPKTVKSFVGKLHLQGDKYREDPVRLMPDKVGGRVELLREGDIELVLEALQQDEAFEFLVEPEFKGGIGDVTAVGYTSIHIDVVPHPCLGDVPEGLGHVEVQLRTMAQGLWAEAMHDLGYKGVVDLDDDQTRAVNRLTALLEMFDKEVARVRDEIVNDERYPLERLLQVLRDARATFGRPVESQVELTRRMLVALLGNAFDPIEIADSLAPWVEKNRDHLKETLAQYVDAERQIYVDRPEGLLAFYLLSRRPTQLVRAWTEQGHHPQILEELSLAWGEALPELT